MSVAHREYATAQDVQAAAADTVVDGPAAEPHRQQLPQRYDAVLNGGKTRDLGVCRSRFRATTHVGDSAPLASSRPRRACCRVRAGMAHESDITTAAGANGPSVPRLPVGLERPVDRSSMPCTAIRSACIAYFVS